MYSSTLPSTLGLGGVGGQLHASATLTPGKKTDTHFIGGWVGSTAGLDWCGESRPHTGT